jgi:hypothetical protein
MLRFSGCTGLKKPDPIQGLRPLSSHSGYGRFRPIAVIAALGPLPIGNGSYVRSGRLADPSQTPARSWGAASPNGRLLSLIMNNVDAGSINFAANRLNGEQEKSVPKGKPGSKDRSGPFRPSSQELRDFRLALLRDPDAGAEHLRGSCRRGHPVTLRNTVSLGRTGYRCRVCRQRTSLESLHRANAADGHGHTVA